MQIQRQSEVFAYRVATAPTMGIQGFTNEDYRNSINSLLSEGRNAEAIAMWQMSGIPLEQMSRQQELTRHYPESSLEDARNEILWNPTNYTPQSIDFRGRQERQDRTDRQINYISRLLERNQTQSAVESWSQSEIPLSEFPQETADRIKRHVSTMGFPGEREWGNDPDYDWARGDYEDYTIARYHADNTNGFGRVSPSDERLQHPEWYSDEDEEDEDTREYNRIIQQINDMAQSGNIEQAAELAADMGISDEELHNAVSHAIDQYEDDEDDEDDDQICPDCGFSSYWDRDMERHRSISHGEDLGHEGDPKYVDPNEPVENTTDPNAKLKSPWYKKVQHYPSGELPREFGRRNLYRDFNFGTPEIADDSPFPRYYNVNPNQGVYQINDSRRPLHKPPVGYAHYEVDHPDKTVTIKYLDVHPQKRGQGVATALVSALAEDFPEYKINPGTTTGHGTGFVDYMRRNAPGAQDRLDTSEWSPAPANQLTDDQLNSWGVQKRRSPVFAFIAAHNNSVEWRKRIAAVTQDFVNNLDDQFHDWYFDGGGFTQDTSKSDRHNRGPIGHWPNIENFLKEHYPAAHKGFLYGFEDAGPALDDPEGKQDLPWLKGKRYETGPEAHEKYGYDPSEIAAGMMLLHNQSHPFRGRMVTEDQQRLTDIFQKRMQMQRAYEQKQQKDLVTASYYGY